MGKLFAPLNITKRNKTKQEHNRTFCILKLNHTLDGGSRRSSGDQRDGFKESP